MNTLQHKQIKSQKQHLKILWGRGAEGRGPTYGAEGRDKQIPFFKTDLRTLKTSFKKFTTCAIDLLLFFIEIEIIKANENHINISHEKYNSVCFHIAAHTS